MALTLTPILAKPLEQGANPNFGYKLTIAVFCNDFGGTPVEASYDER